MKFTNHIDLQQNQIKSGVVETRSSAPSTPVEGQVYWNTATKRFQIFNGTSFGFISTDSDKLNGQAASFYLDRTNATGSQTASTISDFNTAVRLNRLDQMASPTAPFSLNGQRITSAADAIADTDYATFGQLKLAVSSAAAGIDSKASVKAVATTNISLTGQPVIDGYQTVTGDRILARAQTTASANGVYIVTSSGGWTRATDADETSELNSGAFWFVENGTTYGKSQWRIENTGDIIVGTTSITINQFGAANNYTAGNGLSLTGSTFAVVPKTSGGLVVDGTGVSVDTTVVMKKVSGTIGNGSLTSIAVTHNLNNSAPLVQLMDSAGNMIFADWTATNANTVTFTFSVAPTSNQYTFSIGG